MSRLNISNNLFLEVNELNHLVKFIVDDGYKRLVRPLIKNYGIVRAEDNSYFKVVKSASNKITVNPGLAFNVNLDGIVNDEETEYTIDGITTAGTKKWVILSRAITNCESGTVDIAADGSITGHDTDFTECMRGGDGNFPSKVSFQANGAALAQKLLNAAFEVVKVNNEESALLAGDFTAQSGMKYKIMGTFTPGYIAPEGDKYIYEYDSYNISIVTSATEPILNSGYQFILACLTYGASGFSVSDERDKYMFNENFGEVAPNIMKSNIGINSILQVNLVGDDKIAKEYEIVIDNSLTVSAYTVTQNNNDTIFHINASSNNLLGNNPTLTNDMLNGWIILNKTNMKSLKIIKNEGNDLYISTFYSDFECTGQEILIIPPFREIEYKIKLNNSVNVVTAPFYYKFSAKDGTNRMRFYLKYPPSGQAYTGTTVQIQYRYIDDDLRYVYEKMAAHAFLFNGTTKNYTNGAFVIGGQEEFVNDNSQQEQTEEQTEE